ncbi:S-adenosyl-L-methionine-dependent methyltransferase [Aspergillus pseudodeflectus]|uniref:S-adenosyl-L-methionine-dependent methyltransferase n=1 Tax=Aspergillus pseudodeflectus TaxID=176178 RepID=A0ABR4KIY7_9EURO
MPVVADLTATVISAISTLPPLESIDHGERMQLLDAVNKLRDTLERPLDKVMRIGYAQFLLVASRIALDMGIYEAFSASPLHELTIAELTTKVKGDEKFISRIMRLLEAHDFFEETRPANYRAAPLALALRKGTNMAENLVFLNEYLLISAKLHEFFEATDYRNPEDTYNSPFQYAYNTAEHYFTWLGKRPEKQATFNVVMNSGREWENNWFEFYPVVEKLTGGPHDPERVLVVDIGGNIGHEVVAFRKHFPEIQDRLVLQDVPAVIDGLSGPLGPNIDAISHSMFEPQPIKGARAYYMRTVLHDWPDKQCLEALGHIRDAMEPDSVLLVHEILYPDRKLYGLEATSTTVLDFMMMEVFSSLERTEAQWLNLVERGGFKINKVYKPKTEFHFSLGLFEAVVA